VGRVPNPLPLGHRERARLSPVTALGTGQLRRFRDRDVIVRQGSRPEVLFIVEEGVVALATCTPTGQRCVIDLLGPGDPFNEGAIAMAASDAEGLEARAVGSCAVLAIPRPSLEARLRDPLAAWLAASMASRLAEAQRALARSLSLGARERTLELLRTLAGRWGRPSPDGLVVDVPLTQDDMAAMLGLARESVNRALRALHRTGAVRRSGRSYVLASGSSSEV